MASSDKYTLETAPAERWLDEWRGLGNIGFVEGTLDELLSSTHPDARLCQEALAAAEIVAAANGKPSDGLEEEFLKKTDRFDEDDVEELLDKASSAIDIIMEDSELRDRWASRPDAEDWVAALRDLQNRLK
ncbi:DUF4259 domain-containing protein [Cesiribacter andamanensis]|uniref:DUF4259 domain-containing protein n=1 Tax=Cesiribacter andamanensis AMV16 TaxID=1279009 RepID=M7NJS6_9BACT|nr:DUF4259 domain-containing protein [Cesiribacter andamanensis]EMR02050.1 hypothetical protein ADICEAN_02796 [Cesiribacter andamanensis AMV16]